MPGTLARLRRLPRSERREAIELLLREGLGGLAEVPAVARWAAALGPDPRLVHYTFDEPDLTDAAAVALQFTYHLGEARACRDVRCEVRGSGVMTIDDRGAMLLSDVDAELIEFRDDRDHDGTDRGGGPDPRAAPTVPGD
ncbi:MAG TPA: hypothetical protein VEL07_07410 [Planctomycetota bacterium]|nr:hypothetical protein [Planctomycetota bacterium]